MIQTILGGLQILRSKVLQITLAVGLAIILLLKARSEIRQDAQEDIIREVEKADEDRAQAIRERVRDTPRVVRDSAGDDRGFRD